MVARTCHFPNWILVSPGMLIAAETCLDPQDAPVVL